MKTSLEKIFDIPFVIEYGEDPYPWVRVTPKGERGQMFSIKVTNRANVRLIIDFEPQTFSANLIEAMGNAGAEKKALFLDSIRLLEQRGGKSSMRINGVEVDAKDATNWPQGKWQKIEFQTIVFLPFDILETPRFIEDKIREWGCLVMGSFLSLLKIDLLEEQSSMRADVKAPKMEGEHSSVIVNRYERSPVNRYLCILRHGVVCSICGLNFEEKYGNIGKGFIHVHHIVPISKIGKSYMINPEEDLRPVCPNCHAMLHRKDPPFALDELRLLLKS